MTILRSKRSLCASFLIGATLLASLFSGCTQEKKDLRKVPVVKVNGAVLTAGEFSDRLASRLKLFDDLSAKDPKILKRTKDLIVQDFIVQSLTKDWAHKHQIFVRKEDLDAEINKIRGQYPDSLTFRKQLAEQGLSFESWERRLRTTLLERLVQKSIGKSIPNPTAAEMHAYYSANKATFRQPATIHVRQIVVQSKESAKRIKKALISGKKFGQLAKSFSITPEGQNGGDLGWIYTNAKNIFTDKAYPLNRVEVVKDAYGYHIFEVTGKRSAHVLTFDEAQPQITRALMSTREQHVYSKWLEKQILAAHIYKNDDFINKIYVQNRGSKQ